MPQPTNPAALVPYDSDWPLRADAALDAIRGALAGVVDAALTEYDHIGSTAVPGLAAKPFIDLQVRVAELPSEIALRNALHPLGYERARGARPDSPGVYRDIPRGAHQLPEQVWDKSLFVHHGESIILHVRKQASPWGQYAVWFRDWLRSHPDARLRYEAVKRALSAQVEGSADYDDYTRAKTGFFDEVQADFEAWGRSQEGRPA